jgi:hypothetical protein
MRAFLFALDPTPAQEQAFRSHCGAQRFAYNFGIELASKIRAQRAAEYSYGLRGAQLTPCSAYALRRAWNAAKHERAPWWAENSKEAVRHEAPRCIPGAAGRNSEGGSWVRWLTWIRKVKGTTACQKSNGRVQAREARRCGTRAIWLKLDCLNPNLQRCKFRHPPEKRPKPVPCPVPELCLFRHNLRDTGDAQ